MTIAVFFVKFNMMEEIKNTNESESDLSRDDLTDTKGILMGFNYTQFLIPGAILLAAIFISGTLLFTRSGGTAQIGDSVVKPKDKVEVKIGDRDHVLGNPDAKVLFVEFSDFQCPFCRSFWSGALPEIKKNYIDTGKVMFIYKHFPLDFHLGAIPAAEGSECAGEQGKFWEMHDKIYEEQTRQGQGTIQFGQEDVAGWAKGIGLKMDQFNQCISSGKYTSVVNDDAEYGASLGVSGTPTSFINGQRVVGAQPYATFKALIDSQLK